VVAMMAMGTTSMSRSVACSLRESSKVSGGIETNYSHHRQPRSRL
jgi:hypothetical protein